MVKEAKDIDHRYGLHTWHGYRVDVGWKDALGRRRRPVLDRFFNKVVVTDGCWEWVGGCNGGYGLFRLTLPNSKVVQIYAHRFSYEALNGTVIPDSMTIDHLCRNTKCVNPAHMEVVSLEENCRRGYNPSAINRRKTKCKYGHSLDDCYVFKKCHGGFARVCRICWNLRANKHMSAKQLEEYFNGKEC